MIIESLWVLHGLIIIPVIIFLFVIENRKKKVALRSFAEPHLLTRLTEIPGKREVFTKGLFFVLGLLCVIVGLAGPKWGSHYQDVLRKGVDIIFMLDVSKSMRAEDVKPDRLERAKREMLDFLKVAGGDRVGLVLFAGDAFIQCPLTLDYEAISMFVGGIDSEAVPVPGTDLGKGIEVSLDAFDFKASSDKVIVMITDGEDNEEKGLERAKKARENDVKIFIYGIGEPTGAPVPDEKGGFKKDENGRVVLSKLNETSLVKIANLTGGRYVRSVTGDLDLDRLYFEGIRQRTRARELESEKIKVFEERFPVFVGLAVFFLLLEGLLGLKKNKFSLFLIIFLVFIQKTGFAEDKAEELYWKGSFQEAEEAFLAIDMQNPKDVRNRYNRGCASFKNNNYTGASAAFKSVLRRSENKELTLKASYNLGNSYFMEGDYKSAAESFKHVLKLNPEDEDARHNFELCLKMIKEIEDKKKDQKENQEKKDENQQGKDSQEENKGNEKSDDMNRQEPGSKNDPDNDQDRDQDNDQKNVNSENKNRDNTGQDNQKQKDEKEREQAGNQKKDDPDLNGTLKPDKPTPNISQENTEKLSKKTNVNKMSQKEAEALFDNVIENPSDINRFKFKASPAYPVSGKDW